MRKQVLIFGHNDATQFVDIYNQYTRLFPRDKYEVTVAFLMGEENAATKARIIAENMLFLNFPQASIRGLKINAIRTLLRVCQQNKYDIVICHRYKPTYIMMWVAQFYRFSAAIFVMHELGTMRNKLRRLLVSTLHKDNMLFAGVSNAVRDDMRRSLTRVNPEQIITLYNMIDVDLTEPQFLTRETAREKLNLAENDFVFGNIARLAPNKDHKTLLRAFAKIKPQCPNAKLIIIGDGILEDELKKETNALHLESSVRFTGFLATAYCYMKAFDCFTLSSIQEAFGRVLLEAMLAKLPVIATKVHGIPEVLGASGDLITAGDCDTLAEKMLSVYQRSQHERDQIGANAYLRAKEVFSIPAFQQQFWQLPLLQTVKD